jgi:hypothetical protein
MNNQIRLICLLIITLNAGLSNSATAVSKAPAKSVPFRNALTEVSMVHPMPEAPVPIIISLADVRGNAEHPAVDGKLQKRRFIAGTILGTAGIFFLTCATILYINAGRPKKNSSDDGPTISGIFGTFCLAAGLSFGIPAALLMRKYWLW